MSHMCSTRCLGRFAEKKDVKELKDALWSDFQAVVLGRSTSNFLLK